MLLNPKVQRRAQAEIDSVVGRARLPNFGDRASLPFVEAIYRETHRWHPAAPLGKVMCKIASTAPLMNSLGVPHATTSADVYDGYFIPQGVWQRSGKLDLVLTPYRCHRHHEHLVRD